MKALSIRQPWAWAILHAGKDVENRDWSDRSPSLAAARKVLNSMQWGGLFLLHASAGMTRAEYCDFVDTYKAIECGHKDLGDPSHPRFAKDTHFDIPALETLDRGGIVGVARLTNIVTAHRSPWFFGRVGLVLGDVRPCKFIHYKGALGFFDVPFDVAQQALAPLCEEARAG